MKRLQFAVPALIAMLLFAAFVDLSRYTTPNRNPGVMEAFAATATSTATATATATATPTPVPVKISPNQNVTHFAYTAANRTLSGPGFQTASNLNGGFAVYLKATAALVLGQAVIPDASNADSVVVATAQTASHVIGVVVGRRITATSTDQLGLPPSAAQIAIVQVSGVTQMIADGTITIGDTVIVSSAVVGGVADGAAAGTVSADTVGVALSTGAAGLPLDVLLETPRNF
jgi:hypothetical protein